MSDKKRFISLKAKIMLSTLIPVVISFSLICSVIFASLFDSLHKTAESEFLQINRKYAVSFERKINTAMDYLSIISDVLELQVGSGDTDREALQKTVFSIFSGYGLLDGSSIYFEPDKYDGRDSEYSGTQYGSETTGRICYYFYMDNGEAVFLPEALENDIEFTMPHYAEAKEKNKPIYTKPATHEVDGRAIPMFTLTYPVRDSENTFIGAVTADIFLEDIYVQIQNEKIYKTGYVAIENDGGQVIYSPIFEDIGKTREEAGLNYPLPSKDEGSAFSTVKSILNGKDSLVAVESIYIPQLDSYFYISVSAPTDEINAHGLRLIATLIMLSTVVTLLIALLVYYLVGKVSSPIIDLTERANKIANGDMDEANALVLSDYNAKTVDEVHTLYIAIKKMLSQLDEMQKLKLEALELTHEKEKAEASAQAKNDFLAKMSHEIRTPINAVMGMTELILRKNPPPDIYEDALMIKSASANLLSIINDILDFSKIESGKLEVVETDYQFPSLVNDVINIIRIRLVDKPVHFAVNIDSRIPASLIGDEVRLRQIITNLLSNAVKYTTGGYISLSVSGVISGEAVTLTIEVSDSGIGIKEDDINKLFGDFVQIDKLKNKGIEGTGLGLAIARNLCLIMGGSIEVRSEYGKGSTFTVTLPQRFEEYEPFASVDNPGGKAALLYETRTVYKNCIKSTLENLGVECECVDSIPALFENLEKHPFVFISSFMYDSVNPVLSKLKNPPKLVLLADITESAAPKDARILSLPAHALSVANILNDTCLYSGKAHAAGASFIAPGANVLIVDDVTANLKVAEGLMSPYEMNVTLCASAVDSLRLAAENRYDLIFMDHMMPEMDGLEVTSRIRAMEGDYFQSLPIVALTANAVSGVREMFCQNGMNDFLAKPIETAKLDAILDKWIPKEKRGARQASELPEEKNSFVDSLRAIPEFSVDNAVEVVGGSAKTYERIVRLSARLLPENIARLEDLIDTDLSAYMIEVHGVKGVLNNMGAYGLGAEASKLEQESRFGNFDECEKLHPVFINNLVRFQAAIAGLTNKIESPSEMCGDISLLKDAVRKLKDAADFYDSALALEILSSFEGQTFGHGVDEAVAELTSAFERFDFENALKRIEMLEGDLD